MDQVKCKKKYWLSKTSTQKKFLWKKKNIFAAAAAGGGHDFESFNEQNKNWKFFFQKQEKEKIGFVYIIKDFVGSASKTIILDVLKRKCEINEWET